MGAGEKHCLCDDCRHRGVRGKNTPLPGVHAPFVDDVAAVAAGLSLFGASDSRGNVLQASVIVRCLQSLAVLLGLTVP